MKALMSILLSQYKAVRSKTRALVAILSPEDQMVQSCPEASPTKWHQAHTTWFFETFVLLPFAANYQPFRKEFHWLFNSYYLSVGGTVPEKELRASFSRPSLEEILDFRKYVDREMETFLGRPIAEEAARRVLLGLNHEQQHQELVLTDIKHAFFSNPLNPLYQTVPFVTKYGRPVPEVSWHNFAGGLVEVGHSVNTGDPLDFCFDNETPRHKCHLTPFQVENRCVTCREYLEFMLDDGYSRPEFWLSDGWGSIQQSGWRAPLYWERYAKDEAGWRVFTLNGWYGLSVLLDTPVCHISFFEADAFARWRGCRLPTEVEWEVAASQTPPQGNFLDSGRLHPAMASSKGVDQLFGDCWEWTASAYTAYPGFKSIPGSLGEYNGKFMSGQMILRGGSCATPAGHVRATYRNFFKPATRWQFTGIRLAV
jgi:ergothioneine biosynthesis protein EgtB